MIFNCRCDSIPSLKEYTRKIEEAEEKRIHSNLSEEVHSIGYLNLDSI